MKIFVSPPPSLPPFLIYSECTPVLRHWALQKALQTRRAGIQDSSESFLARTNKCKPLRQNRSGVPGQTVASLIIQNPSLLSRQQVQRNGRRKQKKKKKREKGRTKHRFYFFFVYFNESCWSCLEKIVFFLTPYNFEKRCIDFFQGQLVEVGEPKDHSGQRTTKIPFLLRKKQHILEQ